MDLKSYNQLLASPTFQELLAMATADIKSYAATFDRAGTMESAARAYDRREGGEHALMFLISQGKALEGKGPGLAGVEPTFESDEIRARELDPRKE